MIPLPENVQSGALYSTPIHKPTARRLFVKATRFIIVVAVIFLMLLVLLMLLLLFPLMLLLFPILKFIVLAVAVVINVIFNRDLLITKKKPWNGNEGRAIANVT